jgi:hypothetical protein
MRIFVGYGYNARDRWIEELVFPIINAFGDEVTTGEHLQGEQITDGVRNTIRQSDAMIGFLTRRGERDGVGKWGTHRWVTDELSFALANDLKVVEVREHEVDDQGGIIGDRQRLVYDPDARDRCLVEIVKAVGRWHQGRALKFQLLPQEFGEEIFPVLNSKDLRCTYRYMDDDFESQKLPTEIVPIESGLFVRMKHIPRGALVQVQVESRGNVWTSPYVGTDALAIRLRKR